MGPPQHWCRNRPVPWCPRCPHRKRAGPYLRHRRRWHPSKSQQSAGPLGTLRWATVCCMQIRAGLHCARSGTTVVPWRWCSCRSCPRQSSHLPGKSPRYRPPRDRLRWCGAQSHLLWALRPLSESSRCRFRPAHRWPSRSLYSSQALCTCKPAIPPWTVQNRPQSPKNSSLSIHHPWSHCRQSSPSRARCPRLHQHRQRKLDRCSEEQKLLFVSLPYLLIPIHP